MRPQTTGAARSRTTAARIRKVGALLASDQHGEAAAAAHALHRLADGLARAADHQHELEACLGFAADALGALAREVEQLRRDNARLRATPPIRSIGTKPI
jgi:hypothetical protein